MNEIVLENITKTYKPGLLKKQVRAVTDLSLDIAPGEVYGLIGPNGAGKSTTIRMLLELIRPDSGRILFRGKALKDVDIRAEIGYLPENPYLYDHLTLKELLEFCGRTVSLDAAKIKRNSHELVDNLNLLDAMKRPLRSFSKGMLQRAGICFALLHDPSIIILDEPMSGLDPVGRKLVFDLVTELKNKGKTILFCSHILNDVERLCDRIGLIVNGKLIREFDCDDFLQSVSGAVFLLTSPLDERHKAELQNIVIQLRDEENGCLLAILPENYHSVSRCLERFGIVVQGCRSEWMSLENLFMQYVREQMV